MKLILAVSFLQSLSISAQAQTSETFLGSFERKIYISARFVDQRTGETTRVEKSHFTEKQAAHRAIDGSINVVASQIDLEKGDVKSIEVDAQTASSDFEPSKYGNNLETCESTRGKLVDFESKNLGRIKACYRTNKDFGKISEFWTANIPGSIVEGTLKDLDTGEVTHSFETVRFELPKSN
jgi:hypothetical protein